MNIYEYSTLSLVFPTEISDYFNVSSKGWPQRLHSYLHDRGENVRPYSFPTITPIPQSVVQGRGIILLL